MSILPKNVRKVAKETPRNFVIYGGTMEGKTFFSDEFPNAINLNTDGNAEMIETPSIEIRNFRDKNGKINKPASEVLIEAITELESTNHTFETVVIDVIDDVITLFEQEIIEENNVKTIGDMGWGKGHSTLEMMVRVLVMRLKELTMKKNINVLYLSRLTTIEENESTTYLPSLKEKFLNIVNGNSDYMILCRKVGKNYIRRVESKRKNYTRDKVDDERIAALLDTVSGAYDRSQRTNKNKQDELVKQEEEKQQQVKAATEVAEKKEAPAKNNAVEDQEKEKKESDLKRIKETTKEIKEKQKESKGGDNKDTEKEEPAPRRRRRRRVEA